MCVRCLITLIIAAFVFGAVGCQPADPLDRKVTADTPIAFALWRSRMTEKLGTEQWREFEEVLQEIRFMIIRDDGSGSSQAVERALHAKITGRSIREVMMLGWQAKLAQLKAEHDEAARVIRANEILRTRPGDHESVEYLEYRRGAQAARLEKILEEIRRTERRLRILDPRTVPTSQPG